MLSKVDMIMKLYPKIQEYCNKTQQAIEETALRLYGDTFAIVRSIDKLLEFKNNLINLNVMVNEILSELDENERIVLIEYYSDGSTYKEIADKLNMSTSTASRLATRARNRFERMCYRYGFIHNFLENTNMRIAV